MVLFTLLKLSQFSKNQPFSAKIGYSHSIPKIFYEFSSKLALLFFQNDILGQKNANLKNTKIRRKTAENFQKSQKLPVFYIGELLESGIPAPELVGPRTEKIHKRECTRINKNPKILYQLAVRGQSTLAPTIARTKRCVDPWLEQCPNHDTLYNRDKNFHIVNFFPLWIDNL